MKYMMIFQIAVSSLFAHGRESEHIHFFSSMHAEYFAFFIVTILSGYIIYIKLFKGNK